jgi:hypothetical protein
VVLTGYNTDIEHSGTIYHVQTEDKGQSNPFVESLVYASGEILYSRRTPYHDLVEQEVDPQTVATIMERQHRAIVDAIGAGQLAQLLSQDEVADDDDTTVSHPEPVHPLPSSGEASLDQVILDYLEAQRGKAHLILRANSDHDFTYGETAEVNIVAVESHSNNPQRGVLVSVMFKSTAEPRRLVLAQGETDTSGGFQASTELPAYNGGTSAIVISAQSELGQSEIKHLVHR